jgi:hypothetical protein
MAGLTGPLLAPVRAASTVGSNVTLTGLQLVDDVLTEAGDRVLLGFQSQGGENGVWVASTGVWARASDANVTAAVDRNTQVYVREGVTHRGQLQVQSAIPPSNAAIGTWTQSWSSFAAAGIGGIFNYPVPLSLGQLYANQNTGFLHFWSGAYGWQTASGFVSCTSTTRPVWVVEGNTIYETDTGRYYVRLGTSWMLVGTAGLDDTTWIAPTLLSSWTNYSVPTWEPAGYRRIGGVVYLRGMLKPGTVTVGATLFTLPAGYRPGGNQHVSVPTSTDPASRINIMTDGTVKLNLAMTGAVWASLANISFPADG